MTVLTCLQTLLREQSEQEKVVGERTRAHTCLGTKGIVYPCSRAPQDSPESEDACLSISSPFAIVWTALCSPPLLRRNENGRSAGGASLMDNNRGQRRRSVVGKNISLTSVCLPIRRDGQRIRRQLGDAETKEEEELTDEAEERMRR